jgi:hypothetical protein
MASSRSGRSSPDSSEVPEFKEWGVVLMTSSSSARSSRDSSEVSEPLSSGKK